MKNRQQGAFILIAAGLTLLACAHLKEAKTSFDQKDYQKTIQLVKKAIAADSTDVPAYLLLAKSYHAIDSLNQALDAIKMAGNYSPEDSDIKAERCQIHMALGDYFLSREIMRSALENFKAAEKACPKDTSALYRVGDIYMRIGRLDEALKRYGQILSLSPQARRASEKQAEIRDRTKSAQSLYEQGMIAWRKGHFITAKSRLEEALKAKTDFEDAEYFFHMAEGRVHYRKGARAAMWDAVESFGKASSIRLNEVEPHFWMARAYEKKDRDEFTNAIDEYKAALEMAPDGPRASECKKKITELTNRKDKLDKFWGKKK